MFSDIVILPVDVSDFVCGCLFSICYFQFTVNYYIY